MTNQINNKQQEQDLLEDKVSWQRPELSRVDIKKTMLGAGSVSDSADFTV